MTPSATVQSIAIVTELGSNINRLVSSGKTDSAKTSNVSQYDSACLELENLHERLTNLVRSKSPKRILIAPENDLFTKLTSTGLPDFVLLTAFQNPLHTFQLLTNQPENARKLLSNDDLAKRLEKLWKKSLEDKKSPSLFTNENFTLPLPNLIIGTNLENPKQVTERRTALQEISTLGWKTWISYQAVAPISWSAEWKFLNWLVVNGESSKTSRPVHPNWLRNVRDFCAKSKKTSLFFGGWGDWLPKQIWEEMPESKKSAKKWNQFEWGAISLNGDFHRLSLPNPRRSKDECLVLKVGKSKTNNILDGESFNQFTV